MAKKRKVIIGSVIKGRQDEATGKLKADYIKVNGEHTLRDGQYLNLENKEYQLKSLEDAVSAGKLSEEVATKIRANIERIPDFVRFQITTLIDEN